MRRRSGRRRPSCANGRSAARGSTSGRSSADAREGYRREWEDVQARFVDDPAGAVADADSLIGRVMRDRGYPVEDFETRAADVSVDHPDVVENYRAGHGIATAHARGNAGTEELRHAVKHYRALFEELVESRGAEEAVR